MSNSRVDSLQGRKSLVCRAAPLYQSNLFVCLRNAPAFNYLLQVKKMLLSLFECRNCFNFNWILYLFAKL